MRDKMTSKYHVTRFVLDRLGEMEDAPSESWVRALSKMFDRGVPEILLSTLAAKFPGLSPACDGLREARDLRARRRMDAEKSWRAKHDAWIARRDSGNLRARETEKQAQREAAEAAEAQRRAMHESYCQQMQPTWDSEMREIELRRQLQEVEILMP